MKFSGNFKRLLLGVPLALCAGGMNAQLIVVSHTEFGVSGNDDDFYNSIDQVDDYQGPVKPIIAIGGDYSLPEDCATQYGMEDGDYVEDEAFSHFLQGTHYAVVNNAVRLDSFRINDFGDGSGGIVFGTGDKQFNTNKLLMSYTVFGLKGGSAYEVEVEYCNALSKDYLDNNSDVNKYSKLKDGPYLQSQFNASIKCGANNKTIDGEYWGNPGSKAGDCVTKTLSFTGNANNNVSDIADGMLTVNIYMNQGNPWEAMLIKSITVKAAMEAKINGALEVCAGGESTVITLGSTFLNCTYQWYKDGSPIAGATGTSYLHESGNEEKSTEYYVEIKTSTGDKIKSNKHVIKDVACCVDDDGNPMSRKLIWQDDFGTFTGPGEYWTWDYTDINNPVKVKHTVPINAAHSNGWSYCPDYSIPGAVCWDGTGNIVDGKYSIAGNITCCWDNVEGGTQWQWEAQSFNGQKPKANGWTFVPDNTYNGDAYGAMLYLNCGNEAGETIYEREIKGLCDKDVTVKCFINTFSESNCPVEVMIRVTDLNSGNVVESEVVSKKAQQSSGIDWKPCSVNIKLSGAEPKMKFEVVAVSGGAQCNNDGNDLIVDDIQIFTCSTPSVQVYFKDNAIETTSCKGDTVGLYVAVTKMIESYYGKEARYVYQWNKDLEDKDGWTTIGSITDKDHIVDLSEVFAKFEPGDKIYFRVVLGSEETLSSLTKYNKNEACASYSVSDEIVAIVDCPACTEPKPIKIKSADGVAEETKTDGKTTYKLCKGESLTLEQKENITPAEEEWASDEFVGYKIGWYKGSLPSSFNSAETVLDGVVEPKTVAWDAAKAGEKDMFILYAIDANYPEGTCHTGDTVYVKYNETPEEELEEPNEFCFGNVPNFNLTISGYTIEWFEGIDADGNGVNSLGKSASSVAEVFKGLEGNNAEKHRFYYQLTSSAGCVGEVNTYEIDVKEVPTDPEDQMVQMVVTGSTTEPFPMDKIDATPDGYTLIWYYDGCNGCDIAPNINCKEKNETGFEYKIAYKMGECVSEKATVTVVVKAAPQPNIKGIEICAGEELNLATLGDADEGYELHWYPNADGKESERLGEAPVLAAADATPGTHKFYVTQQATAEPKPESDVLEVVITVVGVKEPTADDVEYCYGDEANALTVTAVKDEANYYKADGFVWSTADAEIGATAPKPSTKPVDPSVPTVYKVHQTYTTKDGHDCKGDDIEVKVNITKVADVTGSFNVAYVHADGEATHSFTKDIITQDPAVVDLPATGSLIWSADGSTFGNSVPTPLYKDLTSPGEVQKQEFYVKHREVTANGLVCESEMQKINVTISSTPVPKTTPKSFCDDHDFSAGPTAESLVFKNDGDGKITDINDYTIYWFTKDNKTYAERFTTDESMKSYALPGAPNLAAITPVYETGKYVTTVEFYVVQAKLSTTAGVPSMISAPSVLTLTYYKAPELKSNRVEPVCRPATINLEDGGYWYAEGNVTVVASILDGNSTPVNTPSQIAKSGDYHVKAYIEAGPGGEQCWTELAEPLKLDIQDLTFVGEVPPTTCPDSKAPITLEVNYTYYKGANDNDHTVSYVYSNKNYAAIDNPRAAVTVTGVDSGVAKVIPNLSTSQFPGPAGTPYSMDVTISAGACKDKVWSGDLTIGDGPVVGNIIFTEAENATAVSGYAVKAVDKNTGANVFYSCGGDVTMDVSGLVGDGDFEWFTDPDFTVPATGVSGATPKVSVTNNTTYYARYTNTCYAYIQIDIVPEPVKVIVADNSAASLCEGETFQRSVTIDCRGTNITKNWYKDDVAYSNITTELNFKSLDKATHEGKYEFEAVNKGCSDKVEVVDLTVKKYIKFEPQDFEIFGKDKEKTYIVKAEENVSIPLAYTVPSGSSTGVTVTWVDVTNGTAGSGTADGYTITNLDADHKIHITAEGAEYCKAEDDVVVLKDAKLKLELNLDASMCARDEKDLVVDTVGTGRGVRGGMTLEMIAIPESGTTTQVKGMIAGIDGMLTKKVSPSVKTTYKAILSYNGETVEDEKEIVVYNFSVRTEAVKICEGDAAELKCTAKPSEDEGTILTWYDSDKATQVGAGATATVSPTFEPHNDATLSKHRYYVKASSADVDCASLFSLDVTVYKPITGNLRDTAICEGQSIRLDADVFKATKYEWHSSASADVTTGRFKNDTPEARTSYEVKMKRGECEASANVTVDVKRNPEVVSIDSSSYRSRKITIGTEALPLRFVLDGGDTIHCNEDAYTFDSLGYMSHILVTEDALGCKSIDTFYVVAPPIYVPPFFSPNGDDENDKWLPAGINETYPKAEFTIYDRWGKVVAKFKGEDGGWDGTYNGQAMPSTDYWYEIVVREIDVTYTGHFTLLRR